MVRFSMRSLETENRTRDYTEEERRIRLLGVLHVSVKQVWVYLQTCFLTKCEAVCRDMDIIFKRKLFDIRMFIWYVFVYNTIMLEKWIHIKGVRSWNEFSVRQLKRWNFHTYRVILRILYVINKSRVTSFLASQAGRLKGRRRV